jgi:hypothetical protein
MCKIIIESGCAKFNEFLLLACKLNDIESVSYILEKKPTNLDDALAVACNKNSLQICELLVQNGANITVGLRNSKSANITKMLYRYEQNSEIIN